MNFSVLLTIIKPILNITAPADFQFDVKLLSNASYLRT
jgi:hypothetical protein